MPRETQICFVLRGIPNSTENPEVLIHTSDDDLIPHITKQEVLNADYLASASLPLYDYEEFIFFIS